MGVVGLIGNTPPMEERASFCLRAKPKLVTPGSPFAANHPVYASSFRRHHRRSHPPSPGVPCRAARRMVSFTCDACQDVIKKAKLDNHGCGASFSCIDCGVSFPGTTYRAHTSCISEAEKYQKSLYKGPKKASGQANGTPKANGHAEAGKANGVPEENGHAKAEKSPEPAAMADDKKLSKEERKALKKAEKQARKSAEGAGSKADAEEMEVDASEAAPAEPAPAEAAKAEGKEGKKDKKDKKKSKEAAEQKSEAKSAEPEPLGAQLRKLEALKAEGKDGAGVSDIAAAAAAAGISADVVEGTPAKEEKKSKKEKKAKGDKGEAPAESTEEKPAAAEETPSSKKSKRDREEKAAKPEAAEEPPAKKAKASEAQGSLADTLTEKTHALLAKGSHTLQSLKKELNDSFGSKDARKAAGYNQEKFDQLVHVEVKDGAFVLRFA